MSTEKVKLPFHQRLGYSIGHVLNDLTASMWFSYLIVYFHQVKNFDNTLAGYLMLIGQISDALCTPFVGIESDRSKGIFKLGRRKSWHLVGTICVAGTYTFLFQNCIGCANTYDWAQFIYYAPLVVIFQFGWASTQISHLSLIPDLTEDENERVELNGLRYAFTVLSNLVVFGIFWLLFELHKDHSKKDLDTTAMLTAEDAPKFRTLVFIVVAIGIVFSFIFHLVVKEPVKHDALSGSESFDRESYSSSSERSYIMKSKMTWKSWLQEKQFYQIAVIYLSTRLFVNVSQVYLPLYVTETLKLPKASVAIFPLVVYSSGFVTSFVMRPLNKKLGRKASYLIGQVIGLGACIWIYLLDEENAKQAYGASALLGIGGSTMLITSLAMTADLIGNNVESGAFVYGAMSFTDKLSNGIAVVVIQDYHPCKKCCPACVGYYKKVMSFVPGSVVILALIALLTLMPKKIGVREAKVNRLKDVSGSGRATPVAGYNSITSQNRNTAEHYRGNGIGEREPLL